MDYFTFGKGQRCLVIIPGLSIHSIIGAANAIAKAYDCFSDKYTIYVFDPAQHISDGYSVRNIADDTAREMNALGIKKADVFGTSMGGMAAMCLAIEHPELVNSLVLGSTLARQNETSIRMFDEWHKLAVERDEDGLISSFVGNVYSRSTLMSYREEIISANRGISEEEFDRVAILTETGRSFSCFDELYRICCPVLVLGSKGDRVVAAEGSTEIAEKLNCDIYIYNDTYGHAVYDEAPDYKQRMLDFLTKQNKAV